MKSLRERGQREKEIERGGKRDLDRDERSVLRIYKSNEVFPNW